MKVLNNTVSAKMSEKVKLEYKREVTERKY